ncbi:ras GTPase-activating protein-binding protein 2-like isoform X1 [Chenopodium quinoa]|uniref:G3BP-like protein n=1 Tax=Chenopodium quinoa TaxID=63459 RepID=A0A803LAA6_CHEQI|nr:ras GTPase-activating protein-binding protein 2-like isoform X1 [Chenopodium quinoa]
MAAGSASAFEVGSFFITKYYHVLKESPEFSHQFYNDASTLTRVDGDDTQTVSTILDIHSVLTSLNVSGVEVTKLNCQDSLNGGILVIVSGNVRSRNFGGKRMFTQAFFLAPQENGFYVLNDILQFNDEVLVNQHPVPEPEIKVDSEIPASSPRLDQPAASNFELEEETREYVNSIPIEEDYLVDKYSLPDEEQHEESHVETIVQETPVEESAPPESAVNHMNYVEDPISVPADEPAGEPAEEPAKLSYASILRASKGHSSHPVVSKPAARPRIPPPSEQQQKVQPIAPQLNASASSFVPETASPGADEGSIQEGEMTSVYVRNLPSNNVTTADLEKEFKKFGRIKPNGVVIKNRQDLGICYAFVEFEDISSAQNAIKNSPIELLGRPIYIDPRKPGGSSSSRGGAAARGRGRGGYQNNTSRGRGGIRNPGRGDSSDYNRSRGSGNGFY